MLSDWEPRFEQFIEHVMEETPDPAHDREHVRRVVANARRLAAAEGADPAVVIPAAWLHDCVIVPKHSDHRSRASQMAAERAGAFLREIGYPAEHIPAIEHAIAAHSFSAGIPPRTREAQVVQDADRLDALGAIGIARTLLLGGAMGKPLYDRDEPLPVSRTPDDKNNVIDHFYVKLLGLAATMHTAAARQEGERRTQLMQGYLQALAREVSDDGWAGA